MSAAPSLDLYLGRESGAEAGAPGAVVAGLRRYLAAVREHLERLQREGAAGEVVNGAHSDFVDRLIRRMFALAEQSYYASGREPGGHLAVLAVGGYARREMAIHSDVDLLFLHRGPVDPYVAAVSEQLQYWLWDSGLQVGCAMRDVADTLSLAQSDATVATAILEIRFLVGDVELFHELADAIQRRLMAEPGGFIRQSLEAMHERHQKFGESLYLLQPNLKESPGGLRDCQTALWVTRAAYPSTGGYEDFLHYGLLTEAEMRELRDALQFFWRVRNELHLLSKRKNDQMSFEHQERIGQALGYGGGPELPVESFMRDYYRHARSIQACSELVIEQCRARVDPAASRPAPREVEGGFRVAGDHLEIPHAVFLREAPIRLLEAFEVAQRHDVALSRGARRLVRENLDLIDEDFRRDLAVSAAFQRILDSDERVMRTLMEMNEVGLLGRYLPEWDHIVCRWQHVIYHTYTVDVHSIFLVEQLRRLWKGEYEAELPDLTALVRMVDDRPVLFLGCLLHDVGKGRGGNHSEKGADLARECGERLGLPPERLERVVFLVRHHLLMSHLAQRRDLSDPKLIVDFARTVGDRTNLRLLYLLTFADIRASSPSGWTAWKGQLLRELFERTAEFLETGAGDPSKALEQIEERVELRRESARRELAGLGAPPEKIAAFFDMMPRRYFVAHTPRQIARHAQVVLSYDAGRPVATAVRAMRGGFTEFIVCTRDAHALYSRVAGTITARGINILGSHVYSTRTGLALEVYRLTTPPGGPEELAQVWRGLESMLGAVLSGAVRVEDLLARRRRPVGALEAPTPRPPRVEISNDESDFYTIIDVSADDRPGLLHDLTRTIADHGLEIYISKAATIMDQVADTFYVKDAEGRRVMGALRLEALRQELLEATRGEAGFGDRTGG